MRVIGAKRLDNYSKAHAGVGKSLERWRQVTREACWSHLLEVRRTFPSADHVVTEEGSSVYIFDIKGGSYRLITGISFSKQLVYVCDVMTHAEYDRDNWKQKI